MSYLVRNLFLIFLITFLIISFSPSFFYSLEADSISYIAKNSSRLSIYPTIIEFFGKNSLNHLFYFQTVIFSISLTFLSYCLQKSKIKIKLIIIFHLLILLNFLYTSFCKVVLTECLFFSMINFMVGLILIINPEEKKKIIFILLGFVAGFLISLKPEGIVLALSILIFPVFLVKKKMQNLVIVLLAMLIMPTTENFLYFQNHEKRETIFKHSVAGKIFMISGSDDFKIDNFPFFSEDLLKKISSESKKVRMSVAKIDNFYLRSKLLVDYEVVAQFQSDKILLNYIDEFVKTLDKDYIKIFFYLIYKHPLEYFKLSLNNYFLMWHPGIRYILKNEYDFSHNSLVYQNLLGQTQGFAKYEYILQNKLLLNIMTIFLISFCLITFYAILNLKKNLKYNFLNYLVICSQLHLILVAIANVGSFRYLLPIYPVIILSIIFLINSFFRVKNY